MKITAADCIEVYFPKKDDELKECIDNVRWLRERGWLLFGLLDVGMYGLDLRSTVLRVYIPECTKT